MNEWELARIFFEHNKSFIKFIKKLKELFDKYEIKIQEVVEAEDYLKVKGYQLDKLRICDNQGNASLNVMILIYGIKQENKEKYVDFEFSKKIKGTEIIGRKQRIVLQSWGPDNAMVITRLDGLLKWYWKFERIMGEKSYRKAYLIKEEDRFWNSFVDEED